MRDPRGARRAAVVGALILSGAVTAVSYTQARKLDFDFHHFYRDARYVWDHGALNPDRDNPEVLEQRQLPFYLPVVALMLSPMTFAGVETGAVIWSLMHGVALFASLIVLYRWAPARTSDGGAILGVACLAALPAVYEAARFSQVSFVVLALLLMGFTALQSGRKTACGVLFGFAAVLKLLPGVLLIWLLLKRQWTAVAVAAACIVIVAGGPCLIVFGPQQTAEYHREWLADNLGHDGRRGLVDRAEPSHFVDHRNQSIAAVVQRAFWPQHPAKAAWQPFALSRAACVRISLSLAALLALGLALATRMPATALTRTARQAEFAAYLIAMLVFSPLLRQYYLVWCLPALVVLAGLIADPPSPRLQRLGCSGLAIWLAGMAAWLWPTARIYGIHLLMLVCIAALLLSAARSCNQSDNGQNQHPSSASEAQ